jgi:hypothetical protein
MPIATGTLLNNILNSQTVNTVFTNPIYVALLIVFIIILIFYFIFRNEVETVYEDTSFIGLIFKAGLYTLLATTGLVFIHNKKIKGGYEKLYKNTTLSDTVDATLKTEGASGAYEGAIDELIKKPTEEQPTESIKQVEVPGKDVSVRVSVTAPATTTKTVTTSE